MAVAAHYYQLPHRNGEAHAAPLRQIAQQTRSRRPAQSAHFLPVQLNAALIRQLAREDPKQRGFATAIVAHHGHEGRRGQA